MKTTKIFYSGLCAALLTLPLLTSADPRHNAADRLDRKGDRIETRLGRRGDRINDRLDHHSDRIDRRMDRCGERLQRRANRHH